MTLLASSASAGHRLAICAVSNWVKAGSRLRVLKDHGSAGADVAKPDVLADGARRVSCVEFREGLHVFEGFVVDTGERLQFPKICSDMQNDCIRCIGSVFIPILQQVLDLRDQETTRIVELWDRSVSLIIGY